MLKTIQKKLYQEFMQLENLVQFVNYFDKIKSNISSETYMQTTPDILLLTSVVLNIR